jgi:hypothetical protein
MARNIANSRFGIDTTFSIQDAANHPDTWPPRPDWPITIDAQGKVVSRYADSIWRLDPWSKVAMMLNFGDASPPRGKPISPENAAVLRQIAAFWIWGPEPVRNAGSLRHRFNTLRLLFIHCSARGVLVTELDRFPNVIQEYAPKISTGQREAIVYRLHEIYKHRALLGFSILGREAIAHLNALVPKHEEKQTPYIPPRIWTYQIGRLRECLEDFSAHYGHLDKFYGFCLDTYVRLCGSLENSLSIDNKNFDRPIRRRKPNRPVNNEISGHRFGEIAKKFGVDQLLVRWLSKPNLMDQRLNIRDLTSYLILVRRVAIAYILNFSLMRISEAHSLRTNCLEIEHDPDFGDIYILVGETTKTLQDNDARWPTSPSVKLAVDVLISIARLQLACNSKHPHLQPSLDELENPHLVQRFLEPWTKHSVRYIDLQLKVQNYSVLVDSNPKLFDPEQIRINKEDFNLARLLTPSLDTEKFAIGKKWVFAWHQLRRTGTVNMQASGLVSDTTVQYLLKHSTTAMSLYYGQGYSRLRLNSEVRNMYVTAMYDALSNQLAALTTDRFVSPHGGKRKEQLVELIQKTEAEKLNVLSKSGAITCKEILLGYCMNRSPCPYGGIDSIAHCGGGVGTSACSDVMYDKHKFNKVIAIRDLLKERLEEVVDGPLRNSLLAQLHSAENYISTIGPI